MTLTDSKGGTRARIEAQFWCFTSSRFCRMIFKLFYKLVCYLINIENLLAGSRQLQGPESGGRQHAGGSDQLQEVQML